MPSRSSELTSVKRGPRPRAGRRRRRRRRPSPGSARSRSHEAARQHLLAGRLDDRVRLAGEERLVDLEARGLEHGAVDDDLVTRTQLENVVQDHVADSDLCDTPSRTTRARGELKTASSSRVRLARSSWTMPMSALAIRTPPNSASCSCPTARITTRRPPSRKLNGVITFERMICPTVRLRVSGMSFARPDSRRSATSASVRPIRVPGSSSSTCASATQAN